jgi:hypothetical protein
MWCRCATLIAALTTPHACGGFALPADSPALRAAWSSADDDWRLRPVEGSDFLAFGDAAYKGMVDDEYRTPLYAAAISRRLKVCDGLLVARIHYGAGVTTSGRIN